MTLVRTVREEKIVEAFAEQFRKEKCDVPKLLAFADKHGEHTLALAGLLRATAL